MNKQGTKMKNIDEIKNSLLRYLLEPVEENFEHLTADERSIVVDQETFDQLLKNIGGE